MIEVFGNIWNHIDEYDAIVITTNGSVKKNGEAVMGRGIALEAKERYPWLARKLGDSLTRYGNRVFAYDIEPSWSRVHPFDEKSYDYDFTLYTLPVKPAVGPNGEPGWKAKADINLIEESIKALVKAIDHYSYKEGYKIVLPRPGCGNGGLKWENVRPVIEPYLNNRFTVMEKF